MTEEQEARFKVGDRVRFTLNSGGFPALTKKQKRGTILQTDEKDGIQLLKIRFDCRKIEWWTERCVEALNR